MVDIVLKYLLSLNLNRKWCKRKPFSRVKRDVEFLPKVQLPRKEKPTAEHMNHNGKKMKRRNGQKLGG